ncbi:MAG: CRISPR-associated endonuclease Cas3'', partial [Cyanobacteria bacterium P01_D01_bin.14]
MHSSLLAKSKHNIYGTLTLEQHLIDTAVAAEAIFRDRILKNWCRFFRLSNSEEFLLHLKIAALFHDLGKANADFYNMVQGSCKQQSLRHEWLSALILHLPAVQAWLRTSPIQPDVVTAAVLCHHLQSRAKEWAQTRVSRQ